MISPLPAPCGDCGAQCPPEDTYCWMCHRRLPGDSVKPAPKLEAPPPPPSAAAEDLKRTTPLVAYVSTSVVCGLWLINHTLGFLMSILLLPIFMSMSMSPAAEPQRPRKGSSGAAKSPAQRNLGDHLWGAAKILLATAAIIILVVLALAVALFATCLFIMKASGSH